MRKNLKDSCSVFWQPITQSVIWTLKHGLNHLLWFFRYLELVYYSQMITFQISRDHYLNPAASTTRKQIWRFSNLFLFSSIFTLKKKNKCLHKSKKVVADTKDMRQPAHPPQRFHMTAGDRRTLRHSSDGSRPSVRRIHLPRPVRLRPLCSLTATLEARVPRPVRSRSLCWHPLFLAPSEGISFSCTPIILLSHLTVTKSCPIHFYVIELMTPVQDFIFTYSKSRSSQRYVKKMIEEDTPQKCLHATF